MQKTKIIDGYPFVSYSKETYESSEIRKKSSQFYEWLDKRRTVRDFSDKPISKRGNGRYYPHCIYCTQRRT